MKQPTQNEPQLSAEMEKRFNDFINQGTSYKEIKHFLATALEEQRAAERTKTIEEVLELMKRMMSGQKIDNGHDCYERFCDYCENNIKDGVLEDVVAKLEAMKGQQ